MLNFRYDQAPLSVKVLVTFFLLIVGIGYIFGLINIYNNTGLSYTGLVVHYRGENGDIPPEFAFAKLIHEHHVHIFSIAKLFFLVGVLFVLTNLPEKMKALFIAAPFLGMILDFTSFWLFVFTQASFAWLSIIFGAFMAVSFFFLLGRPLYEMWVLPVWKGLWGEHIPWLLR